jgi:hypothetical protein
MNRLLRHGSYTHLGDLEDLAPRGAKACSLGREPTLLYTTGIATPRDGEDRSYVTAAETPRRSRPSERRRTSSGASLRNVEETAKDKVTEEILWPPSSPSPAIAPSFRRDDPDALRQPPKDTETAGRLRYGEVASGFTTSQRRDFRMRCV